MIGEREIDIEVTGIRPGEKLCEELLADVEHTLPTPHPKLHIAKARMAPDAHWMKELFAWLHQGNPGIEQLRRELAVRVPEYRSQAGGAKLDAQTKAAGFPPCSGSACPLKSGATQDGRS